MYQQQTKGFRDNGILKGIKAGIAGALILGVIGAAAIGGIASLLSGSLAYVAASTGACIFGLFGAMMSTGVGAEVPPGNERAAFLSGISTAGLLATSIVLGGISHAQNGSDTPSTKAPHAQSFNNVCDRSTSNPCTGKPPTPQQNPKIHTLRHGSNHP